MTDSERAAIRAQAFKEAAEIARLFATFNDREENGIAYSNGVEETCEAVAYLIEAAAKGQSQ